VEVEAVGKLTFFPVRRLFISVGSVIGIVSLDPTSCRGRVLTCMRNISIFMRRLDAHASLYVAEDFRIRRFGTPAWVSILQAP